MSLYPSLEDLKVGQILQNEQQQNPPANQRPVNQHPVNQHPAAPLIYPGTNPSAARYVSPSAPAGHALYPTVADYMGLDLSPSEMQIIHRQQQQLQSMAIAQSQKVRPNAQADNPKILRSIWQCRSQTAILTMRLTKNSINRLKSISDPNPPFPIHF